MSFYMHPYFILEFTKCGMENAVRDHLFRKSVKRSSNSLQRDSNDIFALKDKGKIALKIGPDGFSIFCLVFEYSLKNMFRVAKISWKTTLWKTRRDP